jgi:hypothetical protein
MLSALILGLIVLVGLGWAALFSQGVVTTLGYGIGQKGLPNIPLGLTTMFLNKGRTAFFDYDIEIESENGYMVLGVHGRGIGEIKPKRQAVRSPIGGVEIRKSGKGRLEFPIRESGWYKFKILRTRDGKYRGERLKLYYSVVWGAD